MSKYYIIYSRATGMLEDDCYLCGYGVFGNQSDFDVMAEQLPRSHRMIEITTEERIALSGSLTPDGRSYLKRVDAPEAKTKLEDRKKEHDGKPKSVIVDIAQGVSTTRKTKSNRRRRRR